MVVSCFPYDQKHVHVCFYFPAARSALGQVPPSRYDVLRAMEPEVADVQLQQDGWKVPLLMAPRWKPIVKIGGVAGAKKVSHL